MHKAFVTVVLLALAWSPAIADDKKYSLEDLRALVRDKAYKEAYRHLGDIPPSKREDEWKAIAVASAAGVVAMLGFEDEGDLILLVQIETDYPTVLASPRYAKPRATAAAKGLQQCFANRWSVDHCVKVATKLVDHTPKDLDFAMSIAKVARRGMSSYGAVPFFLRALGPRQNEAKCSDEDLRIAVIAGLGLPSDDTNALDAKQIAFDRCFAQLNKAIVRAYDEDGKNGYVRRNTCRALKAKEALGPAVSCPKDD